jgi:hypothetical protein
VRCQSALFLYALDTLRSFLRRPRGPVCMHSRTRRGAAAPIVVIGSRALSARQRARLWPSASVRNGLTGPSLCHSLVALALTRCQQIVGVPANLLVEGDHIFLSPGQRAPCRVRWGEGDCLLTCRSKVCVFCAQCRAVQRCCFSATSVLALVPFIVLPSLTHCRARLHRSFWKLVAESAAPSHSASTANLSRDTATVSLGGPDTILEAGQVCRPADVPPPHAPQIVEPRARCATGCCWLLAAAGCWLLS